MNDRLLRKSEDQIRFTTTPSYNDSHEKNTVEEIRRMRNPELIYLFSSVLLDLLAKVVCSYIVIISPDTGNIKWVIVSYAMTSYNFLKMVISVGYYLIWSRKTQVHRYKAIYRALYSLSFALIAMGMGLYLENKIITYGLYGFAAPYIAISSIIFVIEVVRKTEYSLIALYYMIESVQILLIYINISFPEKSYNWTYTLIIYYVTAFVYLGISIICLLALVIIFVNNCISAPQSNDNPGNIKQATGSLVYDILFYIIWNGYAYYKLVTGFDSLLSNNKIGPDWTGHSINRTLSIGFYVMLICGTISLILWIISIGLKRELLREILYWLR